MRRDPHSRIRRAIAAHFAANITRSREREMRAHLPECAACRAFYDRHLLLAALDPAVPPAHERLALGLGLRARARAPRTLSLGLGVLLTAAAASVVVAVARPEGDGAGAGFAARGLPVSQAPQLLVYRIDGGGSTAEPATETVHPRDELAFAYRNTGRRRNLLVFAVDEHGHVFWYHPEWSRAQDNPAAVTISTEPGLRELPAAVAQRLDGKELIVHALFTDRKLTVREVEAAFAAAAGKRQPPVFPDADDVVHALKVVP